MALRHNTSRHKPEARRHAERIVSFKQWIVRENFVRFHMGLMVSATVAAGVISSKLMLEAGLSSVLIRYPLAVVAAYGVFVGLVKLRED